VTKGDDDKKGGLSRSIRDAMEQDQHSRPAIITKESASIVPIGATIKGSELQVTLKSTAATKCRIGVVFESLPIQASINEQQVQVGEDNVATFEIGDEKLNRLREKKIKVARVSIDIRVKDQTISRSFKVAIPPKK
jgi:hypothetical protein